MEMWGGDSSVLLEILGVVHDAFGISVNEAYGSVCLYLIKGCRKFICDSAHDSILFTIAFEFNI